MTEEYLKGVGGVFISPSGQWFVRILPIGETMAQSLLTGENPSGYLTINDLDMTDIIAHLHILCPLMEPLQHIATMVYNTVFKGWEQKFIVI